MEAKRECIFSPVYHQRQASDGLKRWEILRHGSSDRESDANPCKCGISWEN